jgi:histidyl-tRNA synthetase
VELTRLRGFQDLLGPQARSVSLVEDRARAMAARYNFSEIRIPMMERIQLYQRSTGETSDVVAKQMYVVERADESTAGETMALRPEGTPGVVRAYIEAGLDKSSPYQRFFYIGPMLRYERPQKGRYRQFSQFGVEILGRADASSDAELIIMLDDLRRDLGLTVDFQVNSLGCNEPKCRPRFRAALLEYGRAHLAELCEDCHQRLERNPLRLLDCKIDAQRITEYAPKSLDYLCDACRKHFELVSEFISQAGVPYTVNPRLVRGLDYYTRTAFEVVSAAVGAQSAIAAGGRYDGLVEALGGTPVPGTGFAIGVERMALALEASRLEAEGRPDVAIVGLGGQAHFRAAELARRLRSDNFKVELLPSDRRLRALLAMADRMGAPYAVIIGENEIAQGVVQVRDLKASTQREVAFDEVAGAIRPPA